MRDLSGTGDEKKQPSAANLPFIAYEWPKGIPQSDKYEVRLISGDQSVALFTHMTKPPCELLNDKKVCESDPEGQTGLDGEGTLEDRTFSWAGFSIMGPVTVEVHKLYGQPATRVELSPKGYNIQPDYFDGNTVRFTLTQWRYVSVNFVTEENEDEWKQIRHGLMIFADPPEQEAPAPGEDGVVVYSDETDLSGAKVIYFKPGIYDLKKRFDKGIIPLKSGQTMYLAGGAYVKGAVNAKSKFDIKIKGRGILSGIDYVRHEVQPFINLEQGKNAFVEGITIVEPPYHTMPMTGGNSTVRNIKLIGWLTNNDGIRNGDGDIVDGVFFKTADDFFYAWTPAVVKNSVFWPMWNGSVMTLGWEWGNYRRPISGFTFKDNYIIHPEWPSYWLNRGVLMSQLPPNSDVSDVLIENLYIEGDLSMLVNLKFNNERSKVWNPNLPPGKISNITYRNVKTQKPLMNSRNGQIQKQTIKGLTWKDNNGNNRTAYVQNVQFINLVIGNEMITQDNYTKYFDIDPKTTRNITFRTEGDIYTVKAVAGNGGSVTPSGDIPVPKGMNQTLEIVPETGYTIKTVKVDGRDAGPQYDLVLSNVSADHSVEIEFEANVKK